MTTTTYTDPHVNVVVALGAFLMDPPDSEFQRGYLQALITIYEDTLNGPPCRIVDEAKKLLQLTR